MAAVSRAVRPVALACLWPLFSAAAVGSPSRDPHGLDARVGQDGAEGRGELPGTVADQE